MTHFIKALIVVSTFFGMTNLALAEPNHKKLCEDLDSYATMVMQGRQYGSKLSDVLKGNENDFILAIIIEAYEQPRMLTKRDRDRMVVDFANKLVLQCVKQGLDKTGRDAFRAAVLAKAK